MREHEGEERLAIRLSDGNWHKGGQGKRPNRRRWSRVRMGRRGVLELVDDRRGVRADIAVIDGSLGGLQVRLISRTEFCEGWNVRCTVESSYARTSFLMRVSWVRERLLGLELVHRDARPELARWLSDSSGANTPPLGLSVIEK